MNPTLLNLLGKAAFLLVVFMVGFGVAVKYKDGVQAQKELATAKAKEGVAVREIRAIDNASDKQVKLVSNLDNQLGAANAKIAKLSTRECFSSDTASLLNSTGIDGVPATASESEGETGAPSPGSGLRYTTEADAVGYIALCRTRYAKVAGQLDRILDIEDARHPKTK